MSRISLEQFEADKQFHIGRDRLEVDGLYGMRIVPPETRYGIHLPVFITGIMPKSMNGFQLLGRLVTRGLEPSCAQINPNRDGYFDAVWLMNVMDDTGKEWELAQPGYLVETNRWKEHLDEAAFDILSLSESRNPYVADDKVYQPEHL